MVSTGADRAPWWASRALGLWIAVLAVAVYWPAGTYWQSDDFFAVPYSADWRNVLHDFVGPQYALPPVVVFYRPLITLAFGVDTLLFGANPFGAHLQNALAHGLNALLVFLLAWRLMGRRAAAPAALVWSLAPSHVAAMLWAVGRVDTHSTFWYLLGLLCVLRGRTLATVLVFVLGLMTKEMLMTFPGAAFVVAWAAAPAGQRLRHAARATWPLAVVLAGYLGFRRLALGEWIGGYVGGVLRETGGTPWRNLAVDAGAVLEQLAVPWSTAYGPGGGAWTWVGWGVFGVALIAGVWACGWRRLALCVAFLLLCALPVLAFFKGHTALRDARYYYLLWLPVAWILGSARAGLWLPVLLAGLYPLAVARGDEYRRAHAEIRARHDGLRACAAEAGTAADVFVAGLPREAGPRGTCIAFHMGSDRLLDPPFGSGRPRAWTLRPVTTHARQRQVAAREFTFPFPALFRWDEAAGRFVRVPPPAAVPRFPVRFTGPAVLTTEQLGLAAEDKARFALAAAGIRAAAFRVTVFTGYGTMTALVPDSAAPGATDAEVDFKALMLSGLYEGVPPAENVDVLAGIHIAVGVCKEPEVQVLLEALGPEGQVVACAEQLVPLRFTREFVRWYQDSLGHRPRETGAFLALGLLLVAALLARVR